MKKIFELVKADFPLVVNNYETSEGNKGFALFTQAGHHVIMEQGSYGYDTYFHESGREEAEKTAEVLNTKLGNHL